MMMPHALLAAIYMRYIRHAAPRNRRRAAALLDYAARRAFFFFSQHDFHIAAPLLATPATALSRQRHARAAVDDARLPPLFMLCRLSGARVARAMPHGALLRDAVYATLCACRAR